MVQVADVSEVQHTGDNLRLAVADTLNNLHLTPHRTFVIMTDNGANMVHACVGLCPTHLRCACHTLHLAVMGMLDLEPAQEVLVAARGLALHAASPRT